MTDNRTSAALGAAAAIVLAATLGWPPAAEAQNREVSDTGQMLDGVAAVVNEGVVLRSELREQMELISARLREAGQRTPPRHELEQQVLERLVLQEIQLQRAARLGIQVSDEMLNRALSEMAGRSGISLEQLPQALAQQGIDYQAYRRDMREQLIMEQLRQRDVLQQIQVSEREIEHYLARRQESALEEQDYNVAHILVNIPSSATPEQVAEAEARAADIMQQLDNGADFSSLAVRYSDAQTALEGGQIGWRKGNELPTVFADVVVDLQPGEVTGPLRAGSGLQIVKLMDVRGTERVMVDQVRARHILLSPDEIMDDEAVRQRLSNIREQIIGGDDFASIARSVSEDAVSGADGGDLGWSQAEDFVPTFAQMLNTLEIGEISEPFRSEYGWHIVEVLERRVHDTTEEMQRREAAMAVRQRKFEEEVELWLMRLRDEAFVDTRI